ncbi:Coagulation factor XIII A chain [Channa argus]|uniref:protein-glutamine gamma-glutamyltransferase n=1 Tax=Channa argus TaxID=215402 RepID=A0A6G1QMV8_CHAAH|nr:Coagulation factor XIII A chain [Channa argus]
MDPREPATTNLLLKAFELPEFEAFDSEPGSDAVPRAAPGLLPLSVQSVDMCLQTNKTNHYTSAYKIQNLVIRRGQEFIMKVTFSRPLTQTDDFQVEFMIGSKPVTSDNTMVVATFDSRRRGPWSGRVVEARGQVLTLGITPTANAIVGKYSTWVAIVMANGKQRTKRDAVTDLYLLFNAWAKDDAVFYPNEAGRREYVLNDHGIIYQGSIETADSVTERSWDYGQFERGVLDACIYILDVSKMPIADRSDIIKVVRKGSAMINVQDDNGVLVGNWSDNYSMGTPPTSWTGSVSILLQYASSGVPVCYAQCWVFAGVFNTFLRCLGIPARVITNFISAHDNNGNLTTNLIFNSDGSLDTDDTKDSIWNFHCWNEAYMVRADLPPDLGGWQVVDATPQENSDGYFRCGPASVVAIKEGLLCHPFDLNFVFSEVNSVVVSSTKDRYGTLTTFKVDKEYVGKALYTKAINSTAFEDITITYKYPEGSVEDSLAMARAQEYSSQCSLPKLPKAWLFVKMSAAQVKLGQDVNLVVVFTNQSDVTQTVRANLTGSVTYYTGVRARDPFKNLVFSVTVGAQQEQSKTLNITAQEYLANRGSLVSLSFVVSGHSGEQSVSATQVVTLQTPELTVTVSGTPRVQQQMFVSVSFTNPFSFTLQDVIVCMEGSGLISPKQHSYSTIAPWAKITWKESCIPQVTGLRHITASLDCSDLRGVTSTLCT